MINVILLKDWNIESTVCFFFSDIVQSPLNRPTRQIFIGSMKPSDVMEKAKKLWLHTSTSWLDFFNFNKAMNHEVSRKYWCFRPCRILISPLPNVSNLAKRKHIRWNVSAGLGAERLGGLIQKPGSTLSVFCCVFFSKRHCTSTCIHYWCKGCSRATHII